MTLSGIPSLITLSPSDEQAAPRLQLLAQRLRAGESELVERVLRELLAPVRRWMFRLLGPNGEIDDAVQDAMGAIAGALHRFEGRSSVSTLAHTIVVRVAYTHFGRRRHELDQDAVDRAIGAVDPERQAMMREAMVRFYRCLDRLNETRRTAFVLCVVDALAQDEAARIAGCSPVAMRARLFQARREMDALIREDEVLAPMAREGVEP